MLGCYLFLLKLLECAFGNTVSFIFFFPFFSFPFFFLPFFALFCFVWGQVSLHCLDWPQVVPLITETIFHHACMRESNALYYYSYIIYIILIHNISTLIDLYLSICIYLYIIPIFSHFCLRNDSERRGVYVLTWSSREACLQMLFCDTSSQNLHLIIARYQVFTWEHFLHLLQPSRKSQSC